MITLSAVAVLSVLFLIPPATNAQSKTGFALKGKAFVTAQQAADALIDAAEKYDEPALNKILGPDDWDIVHTDEPARDRELANAFAAQARAKMSVEMDKTKAHATLIVGNEDWQNALNVLEQTWLVLYELRNQRVYPRSQKPSTAVDPDPLAFPKDPRSVASVNGLCASGPSTFAVTSTKS